MASPRKESSRRDQPLNRDYYPTIWSGWEWNERYQRDSRYREVSKGDWEWEYAEPPGKTSDISKGIQGLTLEPTPWTPRGGSTAETAEVPSVNEDYYRHAETQHYPEDLHGPVKEDYHRHAETQHYPEDRHGPEDQQYSEDLQEPEERQYGDGQQSTANQFYRKDTREFRSGKGESRGVEEISCPTCSMIFHRAADLERHHKTVHLNDGARPYQCLVDGCTANVRTWTTADKLRLHKKKWHGGDADTDRSQTLQLPTTISQPEPHIPQATFYGPASPEQPYAYKPPPYHPWNTIHTDNPKTIHQKLDARFRVHASRDFQFGRVFKVLWSEPVGSGGTEITDAKYGEKAFHKIRRFLIVNSKQGHSLCIPILTYGYQGVLKYGIHTEDHAVVYSSRRDGPYISDREEGLMSKPPIRIEVKDPAHKLDPYSRLNYAKVYTVEHNVKVLFIGKVAEDFKQSVITAFNDTHPPLDRSPYEHRPDTPEELVRHAEGPEPTYPTVPMAIPTASYSSGAQQYSSSYATTNPYPYPGPGAQPYTHTAVSSSQPEMPHSGQQQHRETPRYDDGYDVD